MANPKQPGQMVALNAIRHDEREVRRAEAWAQRIEGKTARQIATHLGVSVGVIHDYFQESLAEVKASARDSADTWRRLELDRLDDLIATWTPVSRNPTHPEAARGAAIIIQAIASQTRLLGLLDARLINTSTETPTENLEDMLARSPALRRTMRRQLEQAEKKAAAQDVITVHPVAVQEGDDR